MEHVQHQHGVGAIAYPGAKRAGTHLGQVECRTVSPLLGEVPCNLDVLGEVVEADAIEARESFCERQREVALCGTDVDQANGHLAERIEGIRDAGQPVCACTARRVGAFRLAAVKRLVKFRQSLYGLLQFPAHASSLFAPVGCANGSGLTSHVSPRSIRPAGGLFETTPSRMES